MMTAELRNLSQKEPQEFLFLVKLRLLLGANEMPDKDEECQI